MLAVRNETDQEISWAMIASTFYLLISLGSFLFVQQGILEVSQVSISAILKSANWVYVAHMFAGESF